MKWLPTVEPLEDRRLLASLTLFPSKDNSLFEDAAGELSNGKGEHLFVGKTAQSEGQALRRALVQFNLSDIPNDAEITKVSLTVHVSKIPPNDGPQRTSLHRVLSSWGEGQSDAPGAEGKGTRAISGDATWLHRVYPVTLWDNAGGDFFVNPSATTNLGDIGEYTWSSDDMIDDVNRWLDRPNDNFGWIMIGNEDIPRHARRLDSREYLAAEENRPQLTIEYTESIDDVDISIANAQILEGDSGEQPLDFEVTIAEDAAQTISVDYRTVPGTATAGDDFVSTQGTLTFSPGDARTKTISVPIIGDTVDEADEQFTVVLSNPVGADIRDDTALGIIMNDDDPGVLTISDETIVEGNSGTSTVTVTFSLSSPSGDSQSFTYITVPDTATAVQDYVPAGGQLVFDPGETSKTVDIQIVGDTRFETDETLFVRITGIPETIFGTVTIENDDAPDPTPWHNVDFPEDVNNDGRVVPFDALFIINELNGTGIGVGSGALPNPPTDITPPPYLDVTGDNFLAPIDALRVINFINSNAASVAAVADDSPVVQHETSLSSGRLADIAIAAFWDESSELNSKKKQRSR